MIQQSDKLVAYATYLIEEAARIHTAAAQIEVSLREIKQAKATA